MTRSTLVSIAVLLALAAVGGAVFAVSTGTAERADADRRGVGERMTASGAAGSDTPAKSGPAPGRPVQLDDAIRELDLIRPSRHKVAEDFTVKTANGGSFRLSEHRGKAVLLNFWATWCLPCREEMPAMERLYQRHRERGLVLVAISLDADPAVVPPYVKESRLTFPIALDPKADVANRYGVRALPSSFVVDRHGAMTALALGPRTWDNAAANALVEALTADGAGASRTPLDGAAPSRSTTR